MVHVPSFALFRGNDRAVSGSRPMPGAAQNRLRRFGVRSERRIGTRDANGVTRRIVGVCAVKQIILAAVVNEPRSFDERPFPGQIVGDERLASADEREAIGRKFLPVDRGLYAHGIAVFFPNQVMFSRGIFVMIGIDEARAGIVEQRLTDIGVGSQCGRRGGGADAQPAVDMSRGVIRDKRISDTMNFRGPRNR